MTSGKVVARVRHRPFLRVRSTRGPRLWRGAGDRRPSSAPWRATPRCRGRSTSRRSAVGEHFGSGAWLYGDGASVTPLIVVDQRSVIGAPSLTQTPVPHLAQGVRKPRNGCPDSIGTGVRKPPESPVASVCSPDLIVKSCMLLARTNARPAGASVPMAAAIWGMPSIGVHGSLCYLLLFSDQISINRQLPGVHRCRTFDSLPC